MLAGERNRVFGVNCSPGRMLERSMSSILENELKVHGLGIWTLCRMSYYSVSLCLSKPLQSTTEEQLDFHKTVT